MVKNRQDLFDPYFDNGRLGWWQKKEVYEHRKLLIDGLFGAENVVNYANTIKLILKNDYKISDFIVENTSIEQSHNQNLKKCKKLV